MSFPSNPDYEGLATRCEEFLNNFSGDSQDGDDILMNGDQPNRKYLNQMQAIAEGRSKVFTLDLDDMDDSLALEFEGNTKRMISILSSKIDSLMPPRVLNGREDVFDILQSHRQQVADESRHRNSMDGAGEALVDQDSPNTFPAQLTRRYEVFVNPRSGKKNLPLRQLGADKIGKLVTVSGIVTRITEVRPLVTVATYTCDVCGHEIYQPVAAKEFTPSRDCQSQQCKNNKLSGNLFLQTRGSKFVKYQEIRLQELPDQVPVGNVPKAITVHLLGENTRLANAGNEISVTGIFLPAAYSGFQRIRAGLIADTYIEALSVRRQKRTFNEYKGSITEEERAKIMSESESPEIVSKLAKSIAPEIWGHEDVKTSLLFLLVGGVTKKLDDGMKIRGDLNILLMGDPGVAKSQLLKQVSSIAPRGVYTTGKGSSGVGLTAAVVRDSVTGEMVLEGGALVMADLGICCIDEFDKMEDGDRTAIYEVMEQQTVSLAKAGVTTTLNARVSILAAANPLYGRYKPELSAEKNINLPPALMSRFDLIFLLRDIADIDKDRRLAEHILYVHQHGCHPEFEYQPYPSEFIRKYISVAREWEPVVPKELSNFITEAYVMMRRDGHDQDKEELPCTPRMLLSILRLSQARARLRFADVVGQEDVDEAVRLMRESAQSTRRDSGKSRTPQDVTSAIWELIKNYSMTLGEDELNRTDLLNHIRIGGYSEKQFESTLRQYEELNVLQATSESVLLIN